MHRKKPITSVIREKQVAKRHKHNQPLRTKAKHAVKVALEAVEGGGSAEERAAQVGEAVSALDRAARKGVMHRRAAARKKSRLARRLKVAGTSA